MHIADRILALPPALALLLVFALPALEASAFVGFIVPGEIGVLLGGVLTNQGKLPVWAVLVAGIAGAIIGDSVGYAVGKKYGQTLVSKIPNRILKEEHLDRSQDSIRRNGGRRPLRRPVHHRPAGTHLRAIRDEPRLLPHLRGLEHRRRSDLGRRVRPPRLRRHQLIPVRRPQRDPFGLGLLLAMALPIVVKKMRASEHQPTQAGASRHLIPFTAETEQSMPTSTPPAQSARSGRSGRCSTAQKATSYRFGSRR